MFGESIQTIRITPSRLYPLAAAVMMDGLAVLETCMESTTTDGRTEPERAPDELKLKSSSRAEALVCAGSSAVPLPTATNDIRSYMMYATRAAAAGALWA